MLKTLSKKGKMLIIERYIFSGSKSTIITTATDRIKEIAANIHNLINQNQMSISELDEISKYGVPEKAIQYYKDNYLNEDKLLCLLK